MTAAGQDSEVRRGWLARLRAGLSRSAGKLGTGLADLLSKRKLDAASLEELEELLIQADLGLGTAARVAKAIGSGRFARDADPTAVREAVAAEIAAILAPHARPLAIDPARRPHVVLVVGVNGSGKTTTIGKLAKQQRDAGRDVWMAAGDTFRAAAVEQLSIWADRTGSTIVKRETGADAAGLAFDALSQARAAGAELLLIDTAGRLHNKADLMAELGKVVRVLQKQDPAVPHDTLLVIDATIGQNAHVQVDTFRAIVPLTGLVLTKLDGTAKGGVVVGLADRFGIPIRAVGVGEGADDLRPFDARDFARALVGLES
ncbi:MAG: signal recognition particle-docking protein FtsY [Alphaproteobacteria bacterium]|nr:signal recognition particle-docking protein FtsY [Alphaproteobacteria bacterium]